jgi:FkbM family methyltransferase
MLGDVASHHLITENIDYVRALTSRASAHFQAVDGATIQCSIKDVTLHLRTREEMGIVREVFLDSMYGYCQRRPTIYVDIGMNVGISSLYFARIGATAVYAYEPIPYTYGMAMRNLALNESFNQVIHPHNYGWFSEDCVTQLPFARSFAGSVGILGTVGAERPADSTVGVSLKRSSVVFQEICNLHPDEDIVIKSDCEGAEYAIFDDLAHTGLLSRVSAVMIEWHRNGPDALMAALGPAGFVCFGLKPFDVDRLGMVYAVRRS